MVRHGVIAQSRSVLSGSVGWYGARQGKLGGNTVAMLSAINGDLDILTVLIDWGELRPQ